MGTAALATLLLAQLVLAHPVLMAAANGPAAKQGVQYYNKGWYNKAIPLLTQAAKQNPTDAKTFAYLGKALKKQGVLPQAQQAFVKSLSLNPNQVDVLNELAESYSWKPATRPQAIERYEQSLAINSNQPAVKKNLAQVLYWQGDYDQAASYASQVAGQYGNDKKFMSGYAALMVANKQYDEALRIYESKLNASASTDFYTRQGYAIALVKTGQADKAEQIYRGLTFGATKGNDDQLNALAGLAYELEDYPGALANDKRIARKTDAVQLRMARSYAKTGQSQEALNLLYGLYNAGKLPASQTVEVGDLAFDAITTEETRTTESGKSYRARVLKPGWQTMLPTPNWVEDLYKKAATSGQDKTGVALRLARYYTLQPDRFASATDFYTYVLEQDTTNTAVKTELVDYLKSARSIPGADVSGKLADLASRFPNDYMIQASQAELLSYEEGTRPQALQKYLALLSSFPGNRTETLAGLNQTLEWHQPKQAYAQWYQQVLVADPGNVWAQRSMARAYWQDTTAPRQYSQALAAYRGLKPQLGNDPVFITEYGDFLASLPAGSMRNEALKEMADIHASNPANVDVTVAYANLLSYAGKYDAATKLYSEALTAQPDNRKALAGKSLTLIWSGQKFKAAESLKALRAQYPNDEAVAIALVQAYKAMGRYDKAMDVLKELRQGISPAGMPSGAATPDPIAPKTDLKAALDEATKKLATEEAPAYSQVSVVTEDSATTMMGDDTPAHAEPVATVAMAIDPAQQELDRLDASLKALEQLQTRTGQNLDALDRQVNYVKQRSPLELQEQVLMTPSKVSPTTGGATANGASADSLFNRTLEGNSGSSAAGQSYGLQNNLGQPQSDPFSSTMAGSGSQETLNNLDKELNLLMRPTLRSGFLYSQQGGDGTTNALRSYAFPNQIEMSLTPQIRVRGGYNYRKFWLPDTSISPRVTFANQYSVGTTAKLLDRLTFDGDLSITQFTQSDSTNLTYQARLIADVTDRIRFQAGMRRTPYDLSLLSFSGFSPSVGPLAGQLVGQVRENAVFAQLNMGPWKGWDLNGGYEFAWIDGNNVQNNTKNQAFASLGYTQKYLNQHTARIGVESLFFGFAKNATNGYYDVQGGSGLPVVSLSPATAAPNGVILGGYFSPDQFYLNSVRLDLKGYWLGRLLEYQVGGGVGIQNIRQGVPGVANRNSAAYQANAMLTANVTDWLSIYTLAEYLDSGGLFNRFRVGGGLIVRPRIDAISPVFGK
jgi:tetratricopeptide (TPR) repeat protein